MLNFLCCISLSRSAIYNYYIFEFTVTITTIEKDIKLEPYRGSESSKPARCQPQYHADGIAGEDLELMRGQEMRLTEHHFTWIITGNGHEAVAKLLIKLEAAIKAEEAFLNVGEHEIGVQLCIVQLLLRNLSPTIRTVNQLTPFVGDIADSCTQHFMGHVVYVLSV
jgi:hypothetical protein